MWSEGLQKETRRILEDMPLDVFAEKPHLGGLGLPMKHQGDGIVGYITLTSSVEERYVICANGTHEVLARFKSIDELLAASWAVD